MKDTNYINIQGWMINKLKLKGNPLIIYALIYGFSQDEESTYDGSLSYIAKSIGVTKKSAINLITGLHEKKLIIKYVGKDKNEYQHDSQELERIMQGGEVFTPVKKLHRDSEKSSPKTGEKSSPTNNNNSNNTKDTNTLNYDNILKYLNKKTGKGFRVISDSIKKKFKLRIKEGYTKEDIKNAMDNAVNAPHHLENGFQYLTIEFFSRSSTLDKYGFTSSIQKPKPKTETVVPTDKIEIG